MLATLALAALIYFCLDYVISDDTDSLSRVTIMDFYREEPVDVLFIGTSHSMYAVDSVRLTETLNQSVYNLSTFGPDYVKLYYLLKEAIRVKDIDTVFVELSLARLGSSGVDEFATFIISDYMKSIPNRAALIITGVDDSNYVNGFFRLRRNFKVIPTFSEIKWLIGKKRAEQYTQFIGIPQYMGRGEWYGHDSNDGTTNYHYAEGFLAKEIIPRETKYLTKIMNLCKRKGIKPVLYVMPYSIPYLTQFKDYDQIMATIRKLAEDHSTAFIDLNLVRDEYLHFDIENFRDFDHLNTEAGKQLADFFVEYMRKPDYDWFYDSIREKYPSDLVQGVGYWKSFVTDEGVFEKSTEASGTITEMLLKIEPLSFSNIDTNIVLTELKRDEETDIRTDVRTFTALGREGSFSIFSVPYDPATRVYYRIEVFKAGTDELLFETESFFGERSKDE